MYKYDDFAFLITAYKQVDLVEQNILRIRNEYKTLNNCFVIIVSTSEVDVGFAKLADKHRNLVIIEYPNAPSPSNKFVTKSNTTLTSEKKFSGSKAPIFDNPDIFVPGGRWRYEYIAARILMSMKAGFLIADSGGINTILHLHSDSWWKSDYEDNLINDIEKVRNENLLFYGDVSEPLDNGRWKPGFLFCPEGIVFNIDECRRFGYGFDFNEIYYDNENENGILNNKDQFFCSDFSSTEPLLSEFALWKLTGKNYYEFDVIPKVYYDKVKVRLRRQHHGEFSSGLCNKETTQ